MSAARQERSHGRFAHRFPTCLVAVKKVLSETVAKASTTWTLKATRCTGNSASLPTTSPTTSTRGWNMTPTLCGRRRELKQDFANSLEWPRKNVHGDAHRMHPAFFFGSVHNTVLRECIVP